jgi:hypothetical protein
VKGEIASLVPGTVIKIATVSESCVVLNEEDGMDLKRFQDAHFSQEIPSKRLIMTFVLNLRL